MADLFDRLFPNLSGVDPDLKIPVHDFRAAVGDYTAGYTTRQQIVDFWALDGEAQTDLNALCDAIDIKSELGKVAFMVQLHDVMLIAEAEVKYTDKSVFRTRLGI